MGEQDIQFARRKSSTRRLTALRHLFFIINEALDIQESKGFSQA